MRDGFLRASEANSLRRMRGQEGKTCLLKKSPPKRPQLTVAQIEIVGQFNDYAFENPSLSFAETARKELGPKAFPNTPNGRKFKSECKAIFDAEREP